MSLNTKVTVPDGSVAIAPHATPLTLRPDRRTVVGRADRPRWLRQVPRGRVVSANEHPQPVPAEPRRSRLKLVGIAGVAVAIVVAGLVAAVMLTGPTYKPDAAEPTT